jgi:ABC-type uncharacterized transport system substrate-binding protein
MGADTTSWLNTSADNHSRFRIQNRSRRHIQCGHERRNLRIDARWASAGDVQRHAAELVAAAPDVLVAASGTATVAPLLQATRTIPIVFVVVIDPVGAGFVASLARTGGNVTGLSSQSNDAAQWLSDTQAGKSPKLPAFDQ